MNPETRTIYRDVDLDQVELDDPAHRPPSHATVGTEDQAIPTYYGLPALKPPPWKPWVPAYLYVGGIAGGAAAIGAIGRLDPQLRPLVRRSRWVAAIGVPVGTALLVADMGRPSRFLYMLRVFRPTSVVNVGSWLLSACGLASVGAVVLPEPLADVAAVGSAVTGLFVATYTGALLSNTSVPLWNRARWTLPFEFGASSAASVAAALLPFAGCDREERVLRRLVVGGTLVETGAKLILDREVRGTHAGEPLRSGPTGAAWTASMVLGVAAAVAAVAVSGRRGRLLVAILGTGAALAGRFAIHEAGKQSARDPRAAFEG